MQSFNLKITTPDGVKYDGTCESVVVYAEDGNVAIRARHIDYVTALAAGKCTVTAGSEKKIGACNGGVLSVMKGNATILASTFEWADEIDVARAKEALEKGKKRLSDAKTPREADLARRRIYRANARLSVAEIKD